MKSKEFLRRLKKTGAEINSKRGKGGHVWVTLEGRHSVVPVHGDAEIPNYLIKKICKQLNLDPGKFL